MGNKKKSTAHKILSKFDIKEEKIFIINLRKSGRMTLFYFFYIAISVAL